ncbi:MAG: sigma 54-interacting transcriptional regulator, partial [Candidatus Anammoxibacter sp.]
GYIEVTEGGTIVIENVESLTSGMQNKFLMYLKTGFYMRIGSSKQIKSDVKMIFTCNENIEELVTKGYFNKELYMLLMRQSIFLVPLRERQRDIHDLVDHFIEECSKTEGKNVVGITKEAMNLLLAYDWPNNIDQLKGVVRRAVSMTSEDRIPTTNIFIGPITSEKARGLNLLRFDVVRKFIESNIYPDTFRNIIAAVYTLITLLLLFGFNGYDKKTVLLVWAFGWPLMLVGVVFTSRLFCGLCPMRTIAEKIQKKLSLKLRVPEFIKSKGPFIGIFGFALILSIEHILDMPNEPLVTAGLFLSILGFAVIFSILFDRAIWCRYVCPLGRMSGVYSKLSMVEVRANTSVCNSECRIPTCYNGTDENKGCPMYLGVFNMYTNEDCIMCGQCIKNCKHHSVHLNLRVPAAELFRDYGLDSYRKGAGLAVAFFVPLLIAGVLSMNIVKLFIFNKINVGVDNQILHYILFYIGFYLFCFGLIWFGARVVKSDVEKSSWERFIWFACSFIPIAFAGEIANQIITFINGFGQLVPIVQLQLGTHIISILSNQESTGTVKLLQTILIIMGAVASTFFGKRVVAKMMEKQGNKEYWPVYLVNAIFCFLLISVFVLR